VALGVIGETLQTMVMVVILSGSVAPSSSHAFHRWQGPGSVIAHTNQSLKRMFLMFIILKADVLAMVGQAQIVAQGGAQRREHAARGGVHGASAGCILKPGKDQLQGLQQGAKHGVSSSFPVGDMEDAPGLTFNQTQ
jgi:hypothetical protein